MNTASLFRTASRGALGFLCAICVSCGGENLSSEAHLNDNSSQAPSETFATTTFDQNLATSKGVEACWVEVTSNRFRLGIGDCSQQFVFTIELRTLWCSKEQTSFVKSRTMIVEGTLEASPMPDPNQGYAYDVVEYPDTSSNDFFAGGEVDISEPVNLGDLEGDLPDLFDSITASVGGTGDGGLHIGIGYRNDGTFVSCKE